MPRYDYACAACSRRFEVVHGISEDGPTTCPLCGAGPVRKAFVPPTIHFKGTGWAKKERRATSSARPGSSDDGAGEGGGDTTRTDGGTSGTGESGGDGPKDGTKDGTKVSAKDGPKDASPVSGPAAD
jgi:putative FmdB family regulatory protein